MHALPPCRDSGAHVLLTSEEMAPKANDLAVSALRVDDALDAKEEDVEEGRTPRTAASPNAMLIYTSGTSLPLSSRSGGG